jgi:hypothetical protein
LTETIEAKYPDVSSGENGKFPPLLGHGNYALLILLATVQAVAPKE